MIIKYDIPKINSTLEDFYKATDINMNVLRADFSFVSGRKHRRNNHYCSSIQTSQEGKESCRRSDLMLLKKCRETKKPQMHLCHAGLIDAAAPILYNDVIIGYIIFGEMKASADFSAIKDYLLSLGLDASKMKEYYEEIPFFDSDRIQSVSNIIVLLTKYLLLENMLRPAFDDKIQRAVNYINENLSEKLTIQNISKNVNLSKSALYKRFHNTFNCTLSEYINMKRIDMSCDFLIKTDLSIEAIAQKTGFSSASYYTKTFKRLKNMTPLKYRKSSSNQN